MRIDIATLFPEMCEAVLSASIIGRARKAGKIEICCHNIRDYSPDRRHHRVDDSPYGGGKGMVMQPEPIYRCYLDIIRQSLSLPHVIYLSPQGKVLTQKKALALREIPHLLLLCGHYEGVDERIIEKIADEELSIGDYVLTGGELPAMVMIDAISRMVPGVLSNALSGETESFGNHLLEYPQYSRPELWHEKAVPEILLSGNHQKIEEWRLEQSLSRTRNARPELYEKWAKENQEYFIKKAKREERRRRREKKNRVPSPAESMKDSNE